MNTLQTPTSGSAAAPAAPKPAKAPGPGGALALHLPPVDLVGDTLYLVGFWVEYFLLCTARVAVRVVRVLWGYISGLLLLILRPLGRGLAALARSLAHPAAHLRADLRTLRSFVPDETVQDPARRQEMHRAYLEHRRRLVRRLLGQTAAFVMPVAAAVALFFVVRAGRQMDFVLDVQVNGESVGYVQSEQVFETARTDVQNRLNNARAALAATGGVEETGQWDISPSYTLAIGEKTLSEREVADAIMSVSGDEIGTGTAVYIDGALQFVTTEGDHLRAYLENIKSPYEDPTNLNTRVNFLHDIELEDGVYMLSSIADYPSIIQTFNQNPEIQYYTAGKKETAQTAVTNTGLSWDSLAQMNPELLTLDQEIPEGTQLITGASSPEWLKVKVVERRTFPEDIPYTTERHESNEYTFGQTVVIQEGQTGLQEVTQDITYIDGEVSGTEVVNVERLTEPVTRVIIVGTRVPSGMAASIGTETFVWPAPQYKGVSRWMGGGHRGADITGYSGAPIVASDSGYVTVARNGAGTSYWSYGNYIQIDHGNGWKTLYAHLSGFAVSAGQTVKQGQVIGYMGRTGRASGVHLHFEMSHNGSLYSARNIFGSMR